MRFTTKDTYGYTFFLATLSRVSGGPKVLHPELGNSGMDGSCAGSEDESLEQALLSSRPSPSFREFTECLRWVAAGLAVGWSV